MKTLNIFLRVLLTLSLVLSACGPLAGDDESAQPTTAPTDQMETEDGTSLPAEDADEPSPHINATATLADTTSSGSAEPAATVVAGPRPEIPTSADVTFAEPISIVEQVSPPDSYEEALARIDEFMFDVEELRAEIDRTQFDVTELTFSLDFEPDAIAGFVREEIYFEQYPGLLRGAQGTLMSRAGNALDQSALLATMLGDAGYEVQIARGTLSETEAETLVAQMADPRPPALPVGDEAEMAEIVRGLRGAEAVASLPTVDLDALFTLPGVKGTAAHRDAEAQTEFVTGQLAAAGVVPGYDDTMADVVEEARDYFWVEYRLGPTDDWMTLHPAFTDADAAPDTVEADERYSDTIPEELQHRFRFQVFIEQKVDDELTTIPVTDAWERPVANAVGVNLTYYNHPSGLDVPSAISDTQQISEDTHFFMPMFAGSLAPGAQYFDLKGVTIDPGALSMDDFGMAPLFQTLGETVEDAADALDSLDDEEDDGPLRALTGQWIEYTLVGPDGEETTHRRWVLDRIGAENRAAGQVALRDESDGYDPTWALATYHSFMLAPGTYPAAYTLDRTLERVLAARPLLELLVERSFDPTVPLQLPEDDLVGLQAAPALNVFTAFDLGATLLDDVTTYRDAPALVVYSEGLSPDRTSDVARMGIDVVSNGRRAFRQAGGELEPAPDAMVFMGAWETRMERVGLPAGAENRIYHFNTQSAFEQARTNDISIRVIVPDDRATLQQLALPADALQYLERDLDAGYTVIVPEETSDDSDDAGWWRVNIATGETLGMTSNGGGDEFTEYLSVLSATSTAFAAFFGFMGFLICQGGNDCSFVECALTTLAGAAIGAGIGFAVGAVIVASMLTFGASAGVAGTTAFGAEMVLNGVLLVALPACVEM